MGKAQTFSMQRFMGAFISVLQEKHLELLYRIENWNSNTWVWKEYLIIVTIYLTKLKII